MSNDIKREYDQLPKICSISMLSENIHVYCNGNDTKNMLKSRHTPQFILFLLLFM